ncbi:MAG: hypothetical protein EOO93_01340 [Pedobacter sp.]|nr:MAG: hypothetical protein EOO93_01340 [Pedobacter sp.]
MRDFQSAFSFRIGILVVLFLLVLHTNKVFAQTRPYNKGLAFNKLATKWDEGIPLGNGMLGVLIWGRENKLRLSLDRADLWDERKALDISKLNFKWVEEQVLKNNYGAVQKIGDYPYDNSPYPTKLPAGAIEFNISSFGSVLSNKLDIKNALSTIIFENGTVFNCFIHATKNEGYFSFDKLSSNEVAPELIIHNYNSENIVKKDNSHSGVGLQKLGYSKGSIIKKEDIVRYRQPTDNGNYYEVLVRWKKVGLNKITGFWTITYNEIATLPIKRNNAWNTHVTWWGNFWSKSQISIPDTLIAKQYAMEMYKLGCVARKGAPAITLQAIWTADNGSLPPWKGDFHNDLNTQLSYWPAYTSNHLAEAETFTDWLWKIKPKNLAYTKQYFGVDGLNVPGVATLNGDPMGGWIQYSLSPTVSAWTAQHFYWQWKYSMDEQFLKQKAYPYLHLSATYLENITRLKNGVRKLPLSSSPEYHDNSIKAWFLDWSNFDLSLAKFLFKAAAEVSAVNGKPEESKHWLSILNQLPEFEVNESGFTVAPGENLTASHRHLSQYMAIYPLALLDVNRKKDKTIIENSLKRIEEKGTKAWVGYTFGWMASMYARAYQADKAVNQLKIFASNFCSPNSFHLNGDQKGGEHSDFTYRPFTLEGNFAFAQGVNELLLQSRFGYIQVFPAVPKSWQNVSFTNLRAEGAFLVSALKEEGSYISVKINATQGGVLKIKLPFKTFILKGNQNQGIDVDNDGVVAIKLKKGQVITFENGYE